MNSNSIRNNDYFQIQGWMITELGLKSNELFLYAIIYGYTKNPKAGTFYGTEEYLSNWLGVNRHTIGRLLSSLVNKGYLTQTIEMVAVKNGAIKERKIYEANIDKLYEMQINLFS